MGKALVVYWVTWDSILMIDDAGEIQLFMPTVSTIKGLYGFL